MENSKKISKSYSEEISTMHCNLCNSNLVLKYINQNQRIILCSNKSVIILFFNLFKTIVYVPFRIIRYGKIYF